MFFCFQLIKLINIFYKLSKKLKENEEKKENLKSYLLWLLINWLKSVNRKEKRDFNINKEKLNKQNILWNRYLFNNFLNFKLKILSSFKFYEIFFIREPIVVYGNTLLAHVAYELYLIFIHIKYNSYAKEILKKC